MELSEGGKQTKFGGEDGQSEASCQVLCLQEDQFRLQPAVQLKLMLGFRCYLQDFWKEKSNGSALTRQNNGICNVLHLTENFKHLFKVFLSSWLHTNTFKCPSTVLFKGD